MPQAPADEYDLVGIDGLLGTPNNPDPPKPPVAAADQPAGNPPPPAPLPPRDERGRFAKPSQFTVRMAKDLGMSDEDIAAVEDPHVLEARVYERHLARSQAREEAERARQQIEDLAHRPAAANQGVSQPTDTTGSPPAFDLGLKSVDEDAENGYAPGLVGAFNKLVARMDAQDRIIAELRGHVQRQVAAQSDNEIDQGFAALGSKFEKVFGSGNGVELRDGNPSAYRRRVAVVNDLKANPPKKSTTIKEAVRARAAEMFGDMVEQAAPKSEPTAFTPEQWDQGGLNQPTQRSTTEEAPGVMKARRGVAEKQREMARVNGTGADDKFVP